MQPKCVEVVSLTGTSSLPIKPFVKTWQAPSKLTPGSVSSRTTRAWFSTSSFLTTGFSEALRNLKLCHCSLCLPSTWILLQERGIHALPRSCAADKADASDNSHPQLLLLSLRSGSGQVPASMRGLCLYFCSHQAAAKSRKGAFLLQPWMRWYNNSSFHAKAREHIPSASPGTTLLPRDRPDTLPEMSWDTSKLARQMNPVPSSKNWLDPNPYPSNWNDDLPSSSVPVYLLTWSTHTYLMAVPHIPSFPGSIKHVQTHPSSYLCGASTMFIVHFWKPAFLSKCVWRWLSVLFHCKPQVTVEVTRSSPALPCNWSSHWCRSISTIRKHCLLPPSNYSSRIHFSIPPGSGGYC